MDGVCVTPSMGMAGLYFDMIRAVPPDLVKATIAVAFMSMAVKYTAWAIACSESPHTLISSGAVFRVLRRRISVTAAILFIIETASTGYFPTAVSPDSIMASVPSTTALATSDASALVGLG